MLSPITEMCTYLNNWFNCNQPRLRGTIVVNGGNIEDEAFLSVIKEGQYFRIVGSIFNDGVYRYGDENLHLKDETFVGAIWLMAIPQEVLNLAEEIAAWIKQYEAVDSPNMSPYNSESFGGYSYSKSASGGGDNAVSANSWQGFFASKLNQWRIKK